MHLRQGKVTRDCSAFVARHAGSTVALRERPAQHILALPTWSMLSLCTLPHRTCSMQGPKCSGARQTLHAPAGGLHASHPSQRVQATEQRQHASQSAVPVSWEVSERPRPCELAVRPKSGRKALCMGPSQLSRPGRSPQWHPMGEGWLPPNAVAPEEPAGGEGGRMLDGAGRPSTNMKAELATRRAWGSRQECSWAARAPSTSSDALCRPQASAGWSLTRGVVLECACMGRAGSSTWSENAAGRAPPGC